MRQQGQAAGGLAGKRLKFGGTAIGWAGMHPGRAARLPHSPSNAPVACAERLKDTPRLLQGALARQQPVQYNKESPLNPFFVVYGRRLK